MSPHPYTHNEKQRRYQKVSPLFSGGMWGSNPRHSEPQSDALPTELKPPCRANYGSIRFATSSLIRIFAVFSLSPKIRDCWGPQFSLIFEKRVQSYGFFLNYANLLKRICEKTYFFVCSTRKLYVTLQANRIIT